MKTIKRALGELATHVEHAHIFFTKNSSLLGFIAAWVQTTPGLSLMKDRSNCVFSLNKNIIMCSLKSSGNIQKLKRGPDKSVSGNEFS